MPKEVTLAEIVAFFDCLKEFLESREQSDILETKAQIGELTHQLGRLSKEITKIYAQLGELKYKVEKIESVVSPAHKCLCKQCNKS